MQTSQPFTTIRAYDPAIDRARYDVDLLQRYAIERDEKLLPVLPGAVPVRFHLRRISRRLWDWVEQAVTEDEKRTRAFRASVIRVDALPIDGGARMDWVPSVAPVDQSGAHVPMSETDLERFSYADVYEIGDVGWLHSFFPRDCAASYRLLRSSALVWDQTRSSQFADSNPSGAVQSSAEPKAPQEPSAVPSGGAPTAATVPATVSSVASTSAPGAGPAAP